MKRLIFLSGILTALGCASLQGQSLPTRANIPFEFRVGKNVMPPGEYSVEQHSGYVALKNLNRKMGVFAFVQSTLEPPTGKAALQFRQYGNTRFLAKIWSGTGYMNEFARSSAEKTVAASIQRQDQVVVALQGK